MMTATPSLTKEKRSISVTDADRALEDSDCETSMPSGKKTRTARKLSMTNDDDDE